MAAGVAGCASPPDLLSKHTVQVTIDGKNLDPLPVSCTQIQRQWQIETQKQSPGLDAFVGTDGKVTAQLVTFRDIGGFSGTFSRDLLGEAQASFDNGKFRISGTAMGAFADGSTDQKPHAYTIDTGC